MKLLSFRANGVDRYGVVVGDGVVDLSARLSAPTLKALIAAGELASAEAFKGDEPDFSLAEIEFLPVIPDAAHIWCMAINYQDHIDEIKSIGIQRDTPQKPALFMRYPDSLTGHRQPLLKPDESTDFDFEAELVVIIGKGGGRIPESEAMDHVAGYTAFNDGSMRDWQFHTRQIAPGKNFRSTGALGPWMVTKDEIADPDALAIKARLNGVTLQDSSTRYMIHKIPAFIAYASTILDLQPGDVLATGTPSGVGFSRKPPIFMNEGDTIEVEVEGIGILVNTIARG
ncbi:fumarylacetoacetate hydrolase family protein [Brevundimonas sp.]|uniref:fumarylacetoacetate hydrolase family protein n=1 Tax=Brevundimonas sp. TaxID=1871086 RepID=UPI003D0BA459